MATDKPRRPAGVAADVGSAGTGALGNDIRRRQARDRSYRNRAVVRAWVEQQAQDRRLRGRFAYALLVALAAQVLLANATFVLLGLGQLAVDPWTTRTFFLAVFGQVAALVLVVVKYLFPPPADAILRYLADPP